MIIYVDQKAGQAGDGTREHPYLTISEAAARACPGDEVLVAPGIYREAVDPANAGTEDARITYRSEVPLGAVITGAEVVTGWEHVEGDVWTARVKNTLFGECNPYTTLVSGDWFIAWFTAHIGEVYLDGKALYEVVTEDGVFHPVPSKMAWYPDDSLLTWYARQDEAADETVFLANFGGADPNTHCVEINVRRSCFYPSKEGVGFITLSGFTVKQAATQWAPPTAYQEGMIGPHWSKGWIIEDCEVSDSKCSGISLGKYLQPNNDNKWLKWKYKDGTQTERDCICQAQVEGWSKENIGHHIVRRCHIHDCGQTGIVGHLGGVFSVIEDNHIHHINVRQNLAGAEIGGIKMHAAIDCIYRRNHIHHCTRGIWLDWQAQGTRVTQNLFHDNCLPYDHLLNEEAFAGIGEDIFVEVSHGPTLIDNNLLLSDVALKMPTQGFALVNNIIAGSIVGLCRGTWNGAPNINSDRYTPYHMKHRTEIAGFMTILHGDDRVYQNIFIQHEAREGLLAYAEATKDDGWGDWNQAVGTCVFEDFPTFEEWQKKFEGYCGMGSVTTDRYYEKLPVWLGENVYCNGAKPASWEKNAVIVDKPVTWKLEEEDGRVIFTTNLGEVLPEADVCERFITSDILGEAFEPEQRFENPDGSEIVFDEDFFGEKKSEPQAGPFAGDIASETVLF